MILLHRLTTFVIAAVTALTYILLLSPVAPPFLLFAGLVLIVGMLFGRLLGWQVKTKAFWIFLGTPLLFFVSSLFFYLFLETFLIQLLVGLFVTVCMWLFAENVFIFYYLPASYQAYALEYLSLILFVGGMFFFSSGAYAAQLFLLLPVWVPALAVFWITLFAGVGVFWVSKVIAQKGNRFAFIGSVLLTQLYVAIAMLPTGYYVNAAAFTIFFYLFLGLSRIHLMNTLNDAALRRYIIIGSLLLLAVFSTAAWN